MSLRKTAPRERRSTDAIGAPVRLLNARTASISVTQSVSPTIAIPFGAWSVTRFLPPSMNFVIDDVFAASTRAMNPFPSFCDGLPLMFETKNASRSASYRTDSGVCMLSVAPALANIAGAASAAESAAAAESAVVSPDEQAVAARATTAKPMMPPGRTMRRIADPPVRVEREVALNVIGLSIARANSHTSPCPVRVSRLHRSVLEQPPLAVIPGGVARRRGRGRVSFRAQARRAEVEESPPSRERRPSPSVGTMKKPRRGLRRLRRRTQIFPLRYSRYSRAAELPDRGLLRNRRNLRPSASTLPRSSRQRGPRSGRRRFLDCAPSALRSE